MIETDSEIFFMHHKTFPAHLNHLHEMLTFIQKYGQKKRVESSILNKIILAAEEAIVNIINYGYPNQKGKIEVSCQEYHDKKGLKIQIKDHGIPFDPTIQSFMLDQQQLPKEVGELGGYGIHIFVGIMDRVEYQRLEEGNLLSLIKYF